MLSELSQNFDLKDQKIKEWKQIISVNILLKYLHIPIKILLKSCSSVNYLLRIFFLFIYLQSKYLEATGKSKYF